MAKQSYASELPSRENVSAKDSKSYFRFLRNSIPFLKSLLDMRNFSEEVFELQKLLLHLISPHHKILQNHKQLLLVPNALLCVFKTTH
jgi:hypothetical protein